VGGRAKPGHDTGTGHDTKAEPGHDTKAEPGHDTKAESGHDTKAEPGHDTKAEPGHDTKAGHATKAWPVPDILTAAVPCFG
jgi:hypothetical protein